MWVYKCMIMCQPILSHVHTGVIYIKDSMCQKVQCLHTVCYYYTPSQGFCSPARPIPKLYDQHERLLTTLLYKHKKLHSLEVKLFASWSYGHDFYFLLHCCTLSNVLYSTCTHLLQMSVACIQKKPALSHTHYHAHSLRVLH